ncbi:MAG: hypothetical protein E7259_10420, partial [Lachnospiraceae bacterium]|nr:hypothetical protein [Lachnospiraceae bacterium]
MKKWFKLQYLCVIISHSVTVASHRLLLLQIRYLGGNINMANKWVYLFKEGDASMRNLLGGKGA